MRWDLYAVLTTLLPGLEILVRDDTEALPENQIKRAALATVVPLKWTGKTTAPTVNDDSGDGYAVGDRWIDETNNKEYVALDVTLGAAVWIETTGAGGSGGGPYGGRLSLVTGTPIMTTTQSAKTTVYWTPYNGQSLPIYDGTTMSVTDIGGELSQATTDNTKSPAAVAANKNYDMFVWNDAGTYRCTRGPAWSSDTARGTGASTTELERVKGVMLNKVDITNGPAANRGTYVGSVRSNGSSQIDYIFAGAAVGGTAGIIGVWNMYNRVDVKMSVHDTTSSWTWSSATVGAMDPGATGSGLNNRISYLVGLGEDSIDLSMFMRGRTAAVNGSNFSYGIGIDVTNALSATCNVIALSTTAVEGAPTCQKMVQDQLGFHFAQMCQAGDGTNTSSAYGAGSQNGLIVRGRF
jgi:hypothetical protein